MRKILVCAVATLAILQVLADKDKGSDVVEHETDWTDEEVIEEFKGDGRKVIEESVTDDKKETVTEKTVDKKATDEKATDEKATDEKATDQDKTDDDPHDDEPPTDDDHHDEPDDPSPQQCRAGDRNCKAKASGPDVYPRHHHFKRGYYKPNGGDDFTGLLRAHGIGFMKQLGYKLFKPSYTFATSHDYTMIYLEGTAILGLAKGTAPVVQIDKPFKATHPTLGKSTVTFSWTSKGLLQKTHSALGMQEEYWYFPEDNNEHLHKEIIFKKSTGSAEQIRLTRKYKRDPSIKIPLQYSDGLESNRLLDEALIALKDTDEQKKVDLIKEIQRVEKSAPGSLVRYGSLEELMGALVYDDSITNEGLSVDVDGFGRHRSAVKVYNSKEQSVHLPEGTLITTGMHTLNLVVVGGFSGFAKTNRTINMYSFGCDANYAAKYGKATVTKLRFKRHPIGTLTQSSWFRAIAQMFPKADKTWRL